jgi:hypothetical protein
MTTASHRRSEGVGAGKPDGGDQVRRRAADRPAPAPNLGQVTGPRKPAIPCFHRAFQCHLAAPECRNNNDPAASPEPAGGVLDLSWAFPSANIAILLRAGTAQGRSPRYNIEERQIPNLRKSPTKNFCRKILLQKNGCKKFLDINAREALQ